MEEQKVEAVKAPESGVARMPPPPPPKKRDDKKKRDWKILKDGEDWYFWDTISNETSWEKPADLDDATVEKMKSEYKAPTGDGIVENSTSPPVSPRVAKLDDLEEVDTKDILKIERHLKLSKQLSTIASKHSMRRSAIQTRDNTDSNNNNSDVDDLAKRMELSQLADDIVEDTNESEPIDSEIAAICAGLNDDDLKGVLNARKILFDSDWNREKLLQVVNGTHLHARGDNQGKMLKELKLQEQIINFRKSSTTGSKQEAKMEEEIKRLTNVHTTERKAARAFLDQTKFDIFNYVKSEEMIDQSVLMPEFFAPFPVNKAYVDVEIQFTPNKEEREAGSPTPKSYDPLDDPAVHDHSGKMRKKGNTSHMLTADYKVRYFELDVGEKKMTYFKEKPPRDPLYKLRRRSGNAEDIKALSHVVTSDKQENADLEKRKKLQKGFIDLSTVENIRPSKEKGCPEFSFDIVTPSRVWVLAANTSEELSEWLNILCHLVDRNKVDQSYARYVGRESMGNHAGDVAEHVKKTVRVKKGETVEQVITDAIEKIKRGCEMPSPVATDYAFKVAGFFDFMTSLHRTMLDYDYIANCVSKGDKPVLELLTPQEVKQLLKKMGGKRAKHELAGKAPSGYKFGEAKPLSTEKEILKAAEYSLVIRRVGDFKAYKSPRTNQIFYINEKEKIGQLSKPVGWDNPVSMAVSTISVDELLKAADEAYESALDVQTFAHSNVTKMPDYGLRAYDIRSRTLQDSIEMNWDKINLSTKKPEENPTLLIKCKMGSGSDGAGTDGSVPLFKRRSETLSAYGRRVSKYSRRSTAGGGVKQMGLETLCDDDIKRQKIITEPCLPLRQLRAPFRVRVLGAERELPTNAFYQIIKKKTGVRDVEVYRLSVRVGFYALGEKFPSDWMETREEHVHKRQFIGFGPSRWMETKIFMHNLCSSTRVVFQLMAHVKDDKGNITAYPAASAALAISDFNGRLISGKHALRLFPVAAVDPKDVITGPCSPWSFDDVFVDSTVGASSSINKCRFDGHVFHMPSLYVEFSNFAQVVECPVLYNKSSSVEEDDDDDDPDLHIEKSQWFLMEESSFMSTQWKRRWFILREVTGTLEWYASNRMKELLGMVYLDNVMTEEKEDKSKLYKRGKGSTQKMVKYICMAVNTSSSSSADTSGKKNKAHPEQMTGQTIYISGEKRYEIRAWMDAIARVGKKWDEKMQNAAKVGKDSAVSNKSSTRSTSRDGLLDRRKTQMPGSSFALDTGLAGRSYGVSTNRLEWFEEFSSKFKARSNVSQVRLAISADSNSNSTSSSSSSNRRKTSQRLAGLTSELANYVLPSILIDPQCMHSFCEGISKSYQTLFLKWIYVEHFIFAGANDIDESITVIPSKLSLFEYVIGKRKQLEETMADRNRDGSVQVSKDDNNRGRAQTKVNKSILDRQKMLGLKFGGASASKATKTKFTMKKKKVAKEVQIIDFLKLEAKNRANAFVSSQKYDEAFDILREGLINTLSPEFVKLLKMDQIRFSFQRTKCLFQPDLHSTLSEILSWTGSAPDTKKQYIDHEFASNCLIQLNSNEETTMKWLKNEGSNSIDMPNGKTFKGRTAAAAGAGISGKVAYLRKKWVPLLNDKTSVEGQIWDNVCQGINTIVMKSDGGGSMGGGNRKTFARKNTRRRDAEVSDREKEEQWYQGGKDKKTALKAMKTDPLYQLNSDEKASLWKYKELLKQKEGFPALPKLLRSVNWTLSYEVRAMMRILPGWKWPEKKQELLQLLDLSYQCLPVRNFAVEGIRQMTDNEIASCLPQLVQALKYDVYDMSELGVFLIERAIVQPALIGIPFFWCCKVEFRSAHCRGRYAKYIHEYKLRCGKQQLTLLDRQDRLWSETGVFQKVAAAVYAQKGKSKSKILETLHMQLEGIIKNHELPEIFELPLDPRIRVKMPIVKKCRVMSSAKLPLWLTFENAEPGYEKVMVMFKAGDDLRQDTMVLQLMRVMDSMWRSQNKQLFMSPYKCMATWHDGGLLEIVKNSQTTADIHMQYGGGFTGAFQKDTFIKFIQDHNGKDGEKFDRAVHMFIKSCAAYCVATYIMGIGDRHNDNIMIKKNGQYFHIDFGHFLGNFKYQFGIKRERTPFVFTPEMAEVMGGKGDVKFDDFVAECGSAYNILRENGSTLINLFLLMVPAGMPELASSEDINYLRDQLAFGKGIEDAKDAFKQEIYNALKDRFKQFDNMIHIAKHKF